MPSNFTVLFDANVLYPAPLRDLLVQLATTGLFRARWTAAIHNEWMRNVLKNRPDLKKEQLERTKALMDSSIPDCLIDGYEWMIPSLELPDPEDCHVLAAAVKGRVDSIVTYNIKDFPAEILSKSTQHPTNESAASFAS